MISVLKIPKGEEKKKKKPNHRLGGRERSRNWKEIVRREGNFPNRSGEERRCSGEQAARGQQSPAGLRLFRVGLWDEGEQGGRWPFQLSSASPNRR